MAGSFFLLFFDFSIKSVISNVSNFFISCILHILDFLICLEISELIFCNVFICRFSLWEKILIFFLFGVLTLLIICIDFLSKLLVFFVFNPNLKNEFLFEASFIKFGFFDIEVDIIADFRFLFSNNLFFSFSISSINLLFKILVLLLFFGLVSSFFSDISLSLLKNFWKNLITFFNTLPSNLFIVCFDSLFDIAFCKFFKDVLTIVFSLLFIF